VKQSQKSTSKASAAATSSSKLLFTLKIKLKDQQSVNLEIHEGESINEIVKTVAQSNKLSNELQEALEVTGKWRA
jgi:hypothetical protein